MANGHHLWDDEQGLKTHHLCLESLVCLGCDTGMGNTMVSWSQVTGMGVVSKFQTQGHTVTCHCGVTGFLQCSDVTIYKSYL